MVDPAAPPSSPAPQNPNAEKGARLVRMSRILLLVGILVMFAGCGAAIALRVQILLVVGGSLGFLVIVGAAVVGQIGRAFQGRVI